MRFILFFKFGAFFLTSIFFCVFSFEYPILNNEVFFEEDLVVELEVFSEDLFIDDGELFVFLEKQEYVVLSLLKISSDIFFIRAEKVGERCWQCHNKRCPKKACNLCHYRYCRAYHPCTVN